MTAHADAVAAAEQLNREYARLFARLGTVDHPRGRILSAYRSAIRDLKGKLGNRLLVLEGLARLRAEIMLILREAFGGAESAGLIAASKSAQAYALPGVIFPGVATIPLVTSVVATLDAQIAKVQVGILEEALVLGTATASGILSPLPLTREATRMLAVVGMAAYEIYIEAALATAGGGATAGGRAVAPKSDYLKQAVAAIDERTTDCCLRVHGQVVENDAQFHLTGTPRYADDMDRPPFHWYCRTSVALVHRDDIGDTITGNMREAAQLELKARDDVRAQEDRLEAQLKALGQAPDIRVRKDDTEQVKRIRGELRTWRERERQEIHPSHATSRRG